MQDKGAGFASGSITLRQGATSPLGQEANLFAEYGWTDRLTLGLDLHQTDVTSGHVLVFFKSPLAMRNASFPRAITMTAGAARQTDGWTGLYRLTLSAGREFRTIFGPGWASVDATYEYTGGMKAAVWKLDGTIGINRPGKLSPLAQIETAKYPGQSLSYALIPGLRYRLTPKKDLVFGLEYKQADQRSLGLRIALWQRF